MITARVVHPARGDRLYAGVQGLSLATPAACTTQDHWFNLLAANVDWFYAAFT